MTVTQLIERLREEREFQGWSQQQVAEAAGVTQSAISNIETGVRGTGAVQWFEHLSCWAELLGFELSLELRER